MLFPFQFAGRDFSTKNNMYLQKILEFHEFQRIFYFTSLRNNKLLDLNNIDFESKRYCLCPGFIKCYHLIIHNPSLLTAECATKIFSNSLKNNTNDLFINSIAINAGNTSITNLITLRHKDMNEALISDILLTVHIDPKQKRSIKICDNARNRIKNSLSTKTDQEREKFKGLHDELKRNMDKMINILIENKTKYLFECKLQIQHTDIDMNYHLNQAVYGKFIENTLYEYCNKYYNGKYLIYTITLNFIKEIKINRIGDGLLPFCIVKICNDITSNDIHSKREIIGIIEENNKLCTQFKITLIPDKGNRIKEIRNML